MDIGLFDNFEDDGQLSLFSMGEGVEDLREMEPGEVREAMEVRGAGSREVREAAGSCGVDSAGTGGKAAGARGADSAGTDGTAAEPRSTDSAEAGGQAAGVRGTDSAEAGGQAAEARVTDSAGTDGTAAEPRSTNSVEMGEKAATHGTDAAETAEPLPSSGSAGIRIRQCSSCGKLLFVKEEEGCYLAACNACGVSYVQKK